MLWGKLIDHDKCIGCHACSVACKSENEVPLGSFRTWVKQVEKGEGLSARRHFGVLRCNQCEDAPCVSICPTGAMHRLPNGIIDFENEICIGCKACIQACPYDAIYMDPESNTAAKCNFCAHRIEQNLEPACVAACPTGALVVSDLEDPDSPVAKAAARSATSVRKPELGTRPKVFYKGADQSVLDPRAASRPLQGYWGASRGGCGPMQLPVAGESDSIDETPKGSGAPAAARVAYDVPREGAPWGSKISAYLLTKSIGAGAMMAGGLGLLLAGDAPQMKVGLLPALLGFIFLNLTSLFLVADLRRPERFMLLILKGRMESWLVKGAYVLLGAVGLSAIWGIAAVSGWTWTPNAWHAVGLAAVLAGGAAAGYTAFLFGQARGRAFWQSPVLLPHLVIQAVVAGCAALAIGYAVIDTIAPGSTLVLQARLLALGKLMTIGLVVNGLMVMGELSSHSNQDARLASKWISEGPGSNTLFWGVFVLGHIAPIVALTLGLMVPEQGAASTLFAIPIAGGASLVGLFLWDDLYVRAGQVPALS